MKCPVCPDALLMMSERQGVEIDYCPQCRGVWLDRGELDKLLERAATTPAAPATRSSDSRHTPYPPKHESSSYSSQPHRRKHSSWLSEIFD